MADPLSNPVGTRDLKARLSEYISEVEHHGRHLKVTRNGKSVAVVVPIEWYGEQADRQRRADREA